MTSITVTIPPKRILDRTLTLIEADCIPTAVLHFGIEESDEMENKQQQPENFLKDGLQQTSANGATLAASKSRYGNLLVSMRFFFFFLLDFIF